MTIRPAQRPLGGWSHVRDVEILTGRDSEGRPVVSVRPSPILRSGVTNIADVAVLDQLIADLQAVRGHLEPYCSTCHQVMSAPPCVKTLDGRSEHTVSGGRGEAR